MTKYVNLTTRFANQLGPFVAEIVRGEIVVWGTAGPVATGWATRESNGSITIEWEHSLPEIRSDAEQAIADKVHAEEGKAARRNAKARQRRAVKDDIMDSLGMKRVRGNLGGTYYE